MISIDKLKQIKKGDKLTIKNGRVPYEVIDICTTYCFEVYLPKDDVKMRVGAGYIEDIEFIQPTISKGIALKLFESKRRFDSNKMNFTHEEYIVIEQALQPKSISDGEIKELLKEMEMGWDMNAAYQLEQYIVNMQEEIELTRARLLYFKSISSQSILDSIKETISKYDKHKTKCGALNTCIQQATAMCLTEIKEILKK